MSLNPDDRIVTFPPYTALEEHFLNLSGALGFESAVAWLKGNASPRAVEVVMGRVTRRNLNRLRGVWIDPALAHYPSKRFGG